MNTILKSASRSVAPLPWLSRSRMAAMSLLLFAAGFASAPLSAQTVTSAVPGFISYQGKVTNADGSLVGASPNPVNRTVTLRIWGHQSNSTVSDLIYSEQQTVTISDGEFSVLIGQGTVVGDQPLGFSEGSKGPPSLTVGSPAVFGAATRYLGVTIDDGSSSADPEISPRQQLVSSAYAFRAKYAETLGSNGTNTITALDSGNVGIGTTNPSAKLQVAGGVRVGGAGVNIPSLSLMANSDSVVGMTVGLASSAGNLSTDAQPGDTVFRTDNSGSLIFQSGTAGPAFLVDAANETHFNGLLSADSGIRVAGGKSTHAEGAFLEWNKDGSTGKTYLLNQKGEGSGGIVFGEVDASNSWSEHLSIASSGNVSIGNSGVSTVRLHVASPDTTNTMFVYNSGGGGGNQPAFRARVEAGSGARNVIQAENFNGAFFVARDDGRVGIGTTTPAVPLDVRGNAGVTMGSYTFFNGSALSGIVNTLSTPAISIWASNVIMTQAEFMVFSDERTKLVDGFSDGRADLATLMDIQVTDYHYKDAVAKGSTPQKKVLGQQLEQAFPQSVSRIKAIVPDIFAKGSVQSEWIELNTDLKRGDRVRLLFEGGDEVFDVTEVEAGRFQVSKLPPVDKVFVYGREVDDFRVVDYDAVAMLNVSATQQLKRDKDAEIAELRSANEALAKRVSDLEERNRYWKLKLTAIEQMLESGNFVAKTAVSAGETPSEE